MGGGERGGGIVFSTTKRMRRTAFLQSEAGESREVVDRTAEMGLSCEVCMIVSQTCVRHVRNVRTERADPIEFIGMSTEYRA